MPKKYILTEEIDPSREYNPQAFQENVERALLIALVDKGLLTRAQFDLCLEELKKDREMSDSDTDAIK